MDNGLGRWDFEVEGGVAIASFARPPRNLMTFAAMEQLRRWLESIVGDSRVAVVMITSRVPGYFIGHADLEDLVALGEGRPASGDARIWYRTLRMLEEMPPPIVAAVNGRAWGGGFELSLACTFRLLAGSASFCFLEVDLGLMPGAGGIQRARQLVGVGRAADLVLNCPVVTTDEALRDGLATVALPDAGFDAAARAWCARLAAKPRKALLTAKQALIAGLYSGYDDALRQDGRTFGTLMVDPETIAIERATIERYRSEPPP